VAGRTFRWPAKSLLSGAALATAALAAAGCSALGGGAQNVALAGHTASATPSSTMSGTAQVTNGMAGGFQVLTLNDRRDLTFNQLLGINNEGVIAGYFGSGEARHPNKGFLITPPWARNDFRGENFPGSAQTQVVGLNDDGITVGFFSSTNNHNVAHNNNIGFWRANGQYHAVRFPTQDNATPQVNQLLGVNDAGTAVGFYNDAKGNAHGYAYNLETRQFKLITVRGATSLTATAINNGGAVAGFYTNAQGATVSFIQLQHRRTFTIAFPGASATQAFGLNDQGEVVGAYTIGTGDNAVSHGFTWMNGKFTTVNYPMASSTTINGVNDEGDIVGFYTDAKGNTDGFVGLPL
jgi:hypothetical protein